MKSYLELVEELLGDDAVKALKEIVRIENKTLGTYQSVNDDEFVFEVLAPGYDEKSVDVSIHPTDYTMVIDSFKDEVSDLDWCKKYMNDINQTIDLPAGLDYSTLKKEFKNGILRITGKLKEPKKEKSFSL